MYTIIDPEIQFKKKQKKFRWSFDPFLFTLLLLITLTIIVVCVYYLIIILPPLIYNMNYLLSQTIPKEIQYYHSLFEFHNQTLTYLEDLVLKNLYTSEIVFNNNTLYQTNRIVHNMDIITSTLNVTQIQDNINDIVNTLNRLFPH